MLDLVRPEPVEPWPDPPAGPAPEIARTRGRRSVHRRLWAVPTGVLALLVPYLSLLPGTSTDGASRLLMGGLGDFLPVLALAAGGLLCCHWWFTETQGSARLAAVLVAVGLTTLPTGLVASRPGSPVWGDPPTAADAVTTVALGVLLLAVLHRGEFRRRIEPVVLGLGTGVLFAAFAGLASVGALGSWAGQEWPTVWLAPLVGLAAGVGGAVLVGRLADLPTWVRRELQVAIVILATVWVVVHDASTGPVELVAVLAALTAMVLITLTAAELVARSLRDGVRLSRSLSDRAVVAEGRLQAEEEMLHEVRSTVAGINATTRILFEPDHQVAPVHQERLQLLLVHEVDRLHRMVTEQDEEPVVVDVDTVLNPVVSSFRYLGLEVDWRPGRAVALARPSAVAELVQILLSNVREHAPGSAVRVSTRVRDGVAEIVVADDGPGVPPSQRERVFRRGDRGASSRGHGLGLYIARRLAVQQGGSLTLDPPTGGGASFRVLLPTTGGQS